MDWYEGFFEGDWQDLQRDRYTAEQATAIASGVATRLNLGDGSRVLDVPCGTGRIALALAAMGVHVTGVDACGAFLADARREGAGASPAPEWHLRDMRDLPWEGRFDAVLNHWTSIGFFDEAGERAFAAALHRVLKPGGALLVETTTLETICARYKDRYWSVCAGMPVLEERTMDWLTGRMRTDWTFLRDDRVSSRRTSDLKMYSCA
jgi:cyclopropane fatty-acyl-phospholipid synthase-like methyltransferase